MRHRHPDHLCDVYHAHDQDNDVTMSSNKKVDHSASIGRDESFWDDLHASVHAILLQ